MVCKSKALIKPQTPLPPKQRVAGSSPAGTASTKGEGASIRARGDGLLSEKRPRGLDWGTGGSSIEAVS